MEQQVEKRPRGAGSIFHNGSSTWWIKFSDRGIARRESSHSTDRVVAEKLLKKRLAECLTQTYTPSVNVKIDKLIEDLLAEYRIHSSKTIDDSERRWELHLKPFFTHRKASDLTTDCIRRYVAQRQAKGAANGTINRELALLKRAFHLGLECTPPKVRTVPFFPMLKESDPRSGFLESASYAALAKECARVGLWLRTMFEIGHSFGWRHSEVLNLRVRQVDLFAGSIRLNVGETKNNAGREVSMTQAVRILLSECVRGKQPDDRVFTREGGRPVSDFRKVWANVCVAARVGKFLCPTCDEPVDAENHCATCGKDWNRNKLKYTGLIFHDLRRTACRNMVRAGISEKVAQTVSGHKTRSVFDRYCIVAQSDLQDAARKLETSQAREREAIEKSGAPEFGQTSGRVASKPVPASLVPLSLPMPN
jgi:integrase